MICHLCQSRDLIHFSQFEKLPRASSDCKPWPKGGALVYCNSCFTVQKIMNGEWREEAQQIYSQYELYHQAKDGKEQRVFDSETGSSLPRSVAILNYLTARINIKALKKVLDIGCGVGNMLNSFSSLLPDAALYGLEPNIQNKKSLEKIKNVNQIYQHIKEMHAINFGLVSMVHVLEHIESPEIFLRELKCCISEGGFLLIVVPDYTNNPFDLIIADHATHFSMETLRQLLMKSGFEIVHISNKIINKEIIALCKIAEFKQAPQMLNTDFTQPDFIAKQLNWLKESLAEAKIISAHHPFGIFGTSIAANWIYGAMREAIDFFVDEDQDRVDRFYHQKPVYSVEKIPDLSHVYVCLQPTVSGKIVKRLACERYFFHSAPNFL